MIDLEMVVKHAYTCVFSKLQAVDLILVSLYGYVFKTMDVGKNVNWIHEFTSQMTMLLIPTSVTVSDNETVSDGTVLT